MAFDSSTRPKFDPHPCTSDNNGLIVEDNNDQNLCFTPVLQCLAEFPVEIFEAAMIQLIDHPEHNSTLILRSETSVASLDDSSISNLAVSGYAPARAMQRTLIPRRPGRDEAVRQLCRFYTLLPSSPTTPIHLVILTPTLLEGQKLPYYHPETHHIAFRYLPNTWQLRIEIVPIDSARSQSFDPSSRLYRTCLTLLNTCHRYMWGLSHDYQKRVHHDCIIPRDTYQDLYLIMRERWKSMVHTWKEATDPRKHVFEDIAIATYLMLLWRDAYSPHDTSSPPSVGKEDFANQPWRNWPQPPQGFVDLGCGNGLLTHILVSEGYRGIGIDVRSRTSWESYPFATQDKLFVCGLDPCEVSPSLPLSFACTPTQPAGASSVSSHHSPFRKAPLSKSPRRPSPLSGSQASPSSIDSTFSSSSSSVAEPLPHPINTISPKTAPSPSILSTSESIFRPGQFLISNHADELTPWTPLLATRHQASGYLNIPCCPWTFDRRFERGSEGEWGHHSPQFSSLEQFALSLNLGGGDNIKSGYSQYRIWLAALSAHCGWAVEADVLRVPSTRGWALVGRRKSTSDGLVNVEQVVAQVKTRGVFKIRTPEGRAGDH